MKYEIIKFKPRASMLAFNTIRARFMLPNDLYLRALAVNL